MGDIVTEKDAPPFYAVNGHQVSSVLLICDHAGNLIPSSLGNLGLSPGIMDLHVAFDRGAAGVTRVVATAMKAPAYLTNYSRLVIDCNRAPDHEGLIPKVSDGVKIPANAEISKDQRQKIMDEIYWPYQNAVKLKLNELDGRLRSPAVLVAIHSFTPKLALSDADRPWHIGVSYRDDKETARQLICYLRKKSSFIIGDNQPYALRNSHTILENSLNGRPHVFIEIRRDQISTIEGQKRLGLLISGFLKEFVPRTP